MKIKQRVSMTEGKVLAMDSQIARNVLGRIKAAEKLEKYESLLGDC